MKKSELPINVNKAYAVLIPMIELDGEMKIVLERRALNIPQPDEISFPGGGIEEGEKARDAAIRETVEELGVNSSEIEVRKELPPLFTPFNTIIYPFIGLIKSKEFKPNEAEVSELIFLGLKELRTLKAEIYRSDISLNLPENFPFDKIPNGEEYDWKKGYYDIYFYQLKDITIWGITAKLLYEFEKICN